MSISFPYLGIPDKYKKKRSVADPRTDQETVINIHLTKSIPVGCVLPACIFRLCPHAPLSPCTPPFTSIPPFHHSQLPCTMHASFHHACPPCMYTLPSTHTYITPPCTLTHTHTHTWPPTHTHATHHACMPPPDTHHLPATSFAAGTDGIQAH